MRELLDSATKRRLEVLEQLNERGTWINSHELATTNDASLRTINNDVHYLKDHWFPFLLIETSKKNGVRLTTPPSSHARIVYTSIIKDSEAFQFLERIFFEPNRNLENWVDELYISESSLYRIANQLTHSLNKFGMDLAKRPCQVISQDEKYIRYFYTTYFIEVYGIHDWPFNLNRTLILNLVHQVFAPLDPQIDDVQIIYLAYVLAISLTRQSQGQYTDLSQIDDIAPAHRELLTPYMKELKEIAEPLEMAKSDINVDDLISCMILYRSSDEAIKEQTEVYQQLCSFTTTISDIFSVHLSDFDQAQISNIMLQLYLHRKAFPFNNHILFDQYLYNATTIKNNYPTLTTVVYHSLTELEKTSGFPWASTYFNEILYWLLIKWKELPSSLEIRKAKVKILVLSDLGRDHAEMLVTLVENNFGPKVIITPYQESILFLDSQATKKLTEYDYYISTFYTELLPADKLIVVDAIPSDQNWGYVRRAINKIHSISPAVLDYLNSPN